jgi:hypothetical protein
VDDGDDGGLKPTSIITSIIVLRLPNHLLSTMMEMMEVYSKSIVYEIVIIVLCKAKLTRHNIENRVYITM